MDHVSSLIPSVLRKRGLYDEAHASMIVFRAKKWLQDAHPDIAPVLMPHALKDGVLLLLADHAEAQQEGALLAPALLTFLQTDDQKSVKEVRVSRK